MPLAYKFSFRSHRWVRIDQRHDKEHNIIPYSKEHNIIPVRIDQRQNKEHNIIPLRLQTRTCWHQRTSAWWSLKELLRLCKMYTGKADKSARHHTVGVEKAVLVSSEYFGLMNSGTDPLDSPKHERYCNRWASVSALRRADTSLITADEHKRGILTDCSRRKNYPNITSSCIVEEQQRPCHEQLDWHIMDQHYRRSLLKISCVSDFSVKYGPDHTSSFSFTPEYHFHGMIERDIRVLSARHHSAWLWFASRDSALERPIVDIWKTFWFVLLGGNNCPDRDLLSIIWRGFGSCFQEREIAL